MAGRFLWHILQAQQHSTLKAVNEFHVVFDRYEEDSIKKQIRGKRVETPGGITYHSQEEVAIPAKKWKQFL